MVWMTRVSELGFRHIVVQTTIENTYAYDTPEGEYRMTVTQRCSIGADGKPHQDTSARLSRLDNETRRAIALGGLERHEYADFAMIAATIDRKVRERQRRTRRAIAD